MKALLIPVKDPANAKTRLASLLSTAERRRLAWAMFEDVSRAVARAVGPDLVALVTSYAPAIERARDLAWDVLIEESQQSESASIDWASRRLAERGVESVMRLPADLPLVEPEDIDALLSVELDRPGALLVPSREGTGTNAIIRTPPALFPSRFGPDSLRLHREEARRVGVDPLILSNPRIALDIDDATDIAALLERGGSTAAFSLLADLRVAERIKR
ncbi:MAG TPA: 2-phospho-L-lactate guanylyltransferase [Blastocatellia bacterium]|nr:2-phospho-L-lactate guanylyltransferase [Blastocatellia bacterium]